MMERLTVDGLFCDIAQCSNFNCKGKMGDDGGCDSLRVYERLREYEKAEQDGLLDLHPCAEGMAVYVLRLRQDHYAENPYTVIEVHEYKKTMHDKVGKTVFLTRAEAEAALRKEQEK